MEQDLVLRRAAAGTNNRVQARLAQLDRDLKALLEKIDPMGVNGAQRQYQRQVKLQVRSAKLINEAYADCRRITQEDAWRVGKAAADLLINALRQEIP